MSETGLVQQAQCTEPPVVRNYLVLIVAGIALGLTAPLTAIFATALGASPVVAGIVVAAMPAVTLSLNIVGTRWLPYLEPRRALTFALLIFGLGSAISALAPSVIIVALARALQGFGTVLFIAVGPALAVRTASPDDKGRALGRFNAAWFLGISLGPIVGGSFVGLSYSGMLGDAPQFGLRFAFAVCAIVSVLCGALIFWCLPTLSSSQTPRFGRPDLPEFESWRNSGVLALGGLGQTLRSGLVMTLMPLIAVQAFGFEGLTLGIVLTVVAAFDVLAMFVCGSLSDHIGRLPTLSLGVGIGIVGAMLGFYAVDAVAIGPYLVASALLGTAVGTGWVVPAVAAVDVARSTESGLAAYRIAADIGMAAGSIVIGAIIELNGIGGAFAAVAAVLVATMVLASFIGETTRTELPQHSASSEGNPIVHL